MNWWDGVGRRIDYSGTVLSFLIPDFFWSVVRPRLLSLGLLITPFAGWGATTFQDTAQWTTNYYSVTGATLRAIHQSFQKTSIHGLTQWRVDWRFNAKEGAGECTLNSFQTRTRITITLPKWTAPTNASEALKNEWDRYMVALEQHELGHAQYALATAAEIKKRVKEMGEESNCDTFKKRITSLCQSILDDYKRQEKDYDKHTKYGATQGARLAARLP